MKWVVLLLVMLAGCSTQVVQPTQAQNITTNNTDSAGLQTATFAGGCFWCMEADFEKLDGVKTAVSGYTGGDIQNPTYDTYNEGENYHIEAVQIQYDPDVVSYEEIVEYYYLHIDPTDPDGMFVDRGPYYSSTIWYHNQEQKRIAEQVTQRLNESGVFEEPIITPIEPATVFWPAEEYHQDFYKKNPVRYNSYRALSGRNHFQEEVSYRYERRS